MEPEKRKITKVGDYDIEMAGELGRGAFGAVYRGKHYSTGEVVVAKVISLHTFPREYAQSEVAILKLGKRHENIVQIIYDEEQDMNLWIVMEYCDQGNLAVYSMKHPMSLYQKMDIILQCTNALVHLLHLKPKHIIHRDIKPPNILIKSVMSGICAKICDFGVSKAVDNKCKTRLGTQTGTQHFKAPELFGDEEEMEYGRAVDVFALGLVIHYILKIRVGEDMDDIKFLKRSIGRTMFIRGEMGETWSPVEIEEDDPEGEKLVKQLLEKMLVLDPSKRITMEEVHEQLGILCAMIDEHRHEKSEDKTDKSGIPQPQTDPSGDESKEKNIKETPDPELDQSKEASDPDTEDSEQPVETPKDSSSEMPEPKTDEEASEDEPEQSVEEPIIAPDNFEMVAAQLPRCNVTSEPSPSSSREGSDLQLPPCTDTFTRIEKHDTVQLPSTANKYVGFGENIVLLAYSNRLEKYSIVGEKLTKIWMKEMSAGLWQNSFNVISSSIIASQYDLKYPLHTFSHDMENSLTYGRHFGDPGRLCGALPHDRIVYARAITWIPTEFALDVYQLPSHEKVATFSRPSKPYKSINISICCHPINNWVAVVAPRSLTLYTAEYEEYKYVRLPYEARIMNAAAAFNGYIVVVDKNLESLHMYNWEGYELGRVANWQLGLGRKWILGIGSGGGMEDKEDGDKGKEEDEQKTQVSGHVDVGRETEELGEDGKSGEKEPAECTVEYVKEDEKDEKVVISSGEMHVDEKCDVGRLLLASGGLTGVYALHVYHLT